MKLYLYEVQIATGASDKNKARFYENVTEEGAIPTDYGGNPRLRALSSWRDADAVKDLCTKGFRPSSDKDHVTVLEITTTTLSDPNHAHSAYQNVVDHFLQKGGIYPKL